MPADLAGAIARAGLADGTPVAVASVGGDGVVSESCSGMWPGGRPVHPSDRFYVASLAKQVTGAAAAMLVRDGRLDPRASVAHYNTGLPDWTSTITVEQLAHHTAGLPEAGVLEAQVDGDWTTDSVLHVLRHMPALPHVPGTAFRYSNAGYILLAHVIALRSGVEFPVFARKAMFGPNGLAGMRYVTEAETAPAQLSLMGPRLPLSVGDGGLWCTAGDFARWLHLMNIDAFGIGDIVTSSGLLSDGSAVDYGWGVGLRKRGDRPLFLHGGSWTGAQARAVRMPDPGLGIVVLAACDRSDHVTALVDDLLDEMVEAQQ